jgi:succinate dehydrogenase/fumarate reductase flavoprotein subunit
LANDLISKEEGHMQSIETDVLVIGGGVAGLRAAIEAARNGVSITVISKSPIGVGSNSVLAAGGFSGAIADFSVEDHITKTLRTGKDLNDRELVRELVVSGVKELEFLREIGVDLIPKPYGYWVDKKLFPDKMLGGRIVVKKLMEEALKYNRIQFFPHSFVYKILLHDDRISGVIGFDKDHHPCLISSKAIILATGGGGGIYERNDNYKRILGDGYALAMEIGLPLFDMEFVQFVPLAFAEPGIPQMVLYPPFPTEAKIIDEQGNDLLEKYGIKMDLNELNISSRDEICYLVYKESQTCKVLMDCTHVSDEKWDKYPLTLFPKQRFNFKEKPFQIAPVAHFFMGGIKINPTGEGGMQGLFAAGEVTAGVHGANRMGGNALTECLVFGANSGRSASRYAKNIELEKPSFNSEEWLKPLIRGKTNSSTRHQIHELLKRIREIAWRYVGPIRNEPRMKQALFLLDQVGHDLQNLEVANTIELISKKEVWNALLVMRAIILSSLARKESRGAFQRDDHPRQDSSEILKRVFVKTNGDSGDLSVHEVFPQS